MCPDLHYALFTANLVEFGRDGNTNLEAGEGLQAVLDGVSLRSLDIQWFRW